MSGHLIIRKCFPFIDNYFSYKKYKQNFAILHNSNLMQSSIDRSKGINLFKSQFICSIDFYDARWTYQIFNHVLAILAITERRKTED